MFPDQSELKITNNVIGLAKCFSISTLRQRHTKACSTEWLSNVNFKGIAANMLLKIYERYKFEILDVDEREST